MYESYLLREGRNGKHFWVKSGCKPDESEFLLYFNADHFEPGTVLEIHDGVPRPRPTCTCYEPGRVTDPACQIHGTAT